MEQTHFSELLNQATYIAILKRIETGNHIFQKFFPVKSTLNLTFEAIEEAAGTNIAAFTGVYGSEAGEVKYSDVVTLRGDIPPISIKRILKEKDIIELKRSLATDSSIEKRTVIEKIVDNIKFVVEATLTRLDYYALQLLSTGKIVLDGNTNAGHLNKVIDYKLASWQSMTPTALWSSSSTADPIADIRAIVKKRREKGYASNYILMGEDAFNAMASCDKVVAQTTYSAGTDKVVSGIVTLDAVNVTLRGARLPQIVIVEDNINYVKSDGNFDYTQRAWEQNNIAVVSDLKQGVTLNAPTAEMVVKSKTKAITGLSGITTVQQYAITDPVEDITKGKLNAMCAWGGSTSIVLEKVL